MIPKTPAELVRMRRAGRILASTLTRVATLARPGQVLTKLDQLAERLIKRAGALPAFKGYQGYPFATCLSVNEEIVHGLPRPYRLKEGDLLGIDIGVRYQGYHVDSAITVGIGRLSEDDTKLLEVTREALWRGIRMVKPGVRLGDIQEAIQHYVEDRGLTIVRDLCGHGIGQSLQEEPQIPNFGQSGKGIRLEVGHTFALEPMVTFRSAHTKTKSDGWTVASLYGDRAAHFEHTLAVTPVGVEVVTRRQEETSLIKSVTTDNR